MIDVVETKMKIESEYMGMTLIIWFDVFDTETYKWFKRLQKKAKKKKKRKLGKLKRVRFDIPRQRHPIMEQPIEYSNRANMYCFSSPKFQTVGRRV